MLFLRVLSIFDNSKVVVVITPQQLGNLDRVWVSLVFGKLTQNRKLVHRTRQSCFTQNRETDSETLNRVEISENLAPVASRKRPIPRRVSAGRLSGEPAGSRQSSSGSRSPASHSKVEELILKQSLYESTRANPPIRPSLSSLTGSESASRGFGTSVISG